MGGSGSGRRFLGRDTTDDHLQLDVRCLERGGWLAHGVSSVSRWSRNGEEMSAIGIRSEGDRLILNYRHQRPGEEWQSLEYAVPLETTRCHFGGKRFWFRCPGLHCGRRVATLYCSRYFACRTCLGLAYESQREPSWGRADRRAWAIRKRCGGWGSLLDPVLKPKGMHKRTFERLERAYAIECFTSASGFAAQLGVNADGVLRWKTDAPALREDDPSFP